MPLGDVPTNVMSTPSKSQGSKKSMDSEIPSSPYMDIGTDTDSPISKEIQPRSPILMPLHSPIKNRDTVATMERKTTPPSDDRNSTSPLKVLKSRTSSPVKRFPIKVSISEKPRHIVPTLDESQLPGPQAYHDNKEASSPERSTPTETLQPDETSCHDGISQSRKSDGTVMAESFVNIIDEPEDSMSDDFYDCTINTVNGRAQDGYAGMDDTAFSTFSAVPDMTMFAKIGHSPSKYASMAPTPRQSRTPFTPSTARRPTSRDAVSPSPTPRGHRKDYERDDGNTTNLILDFTEQFHNFSGYANTSPSRRGKPSPSKSRTMPDLLTFTQRARTPSPTKNRRPHSPYNRVSNLLDFDIPPAPTPRSMPSITPRELESLKSGFMSEISSLKASLSGKEAEVSSLKTAVGDAEKRVGESMEQVREERGQKEHLEAEKENWEKRSREMEAVLRNVKEEIVRGEREREDLEGRLQESEQRREAAEMMAQEAETKVAGMRSNSVSLSDSGDPEKKADASSARDVEIAVEKVARELHTLYKSKHETKVAALKKSYESRWDRKVKDLESRLDDAVHENEELRLGRDNTMSGVVAKFSNEATEELRLQVADEASRARELEASLEGLSGEIRSMRADNMELRQELERERVEKGELVAAVDEMLELQNSLSATTTSAAVTHEIENLRGSISRASGLRPPGSAQKKLAYGGTPGEKSRIGRMAPPSSVGSGPSYGHERTGSGPRPGSGAGLRSGIMSSIEKMGSYKGRADQ